MLNRSVLPNKPFCFPLTRQMSCFVSFWAAAQSSQCSQPLAMDSGWWWGPFQSPSPALHPFPGAGPRQGWPLPFPGVRREERGHSYHSLTWWSDGRDNPTRNLLFLLEVLMTQGVYKEIWQWIKPGRTRNVLPRKQKGKFHVKDGSMKGLRVQWQNRQAADTRDCQNWYWCGWPVPCVIRITGVGKDLRSWMWFRSWPWFEKGNWTR